jgi:hypothetical protein
VDRVHEEIASLCVTDIGALHAPLDLSEQHIRGVGAKRGTRRYQ